MDYVARADDSCCPATRNSRSGAAGPAAASGRLGGTRTPAPVRCDWPAAKPNATRGARPPGAGREARPPAAAAAILARAKARQRQGAVMATTKTARAPAARRGGTMPRADVVEMFTRLRELNPRRRPNWVQLAVRAAGGGGAVGAGHRRRQQGHAPIVPGRQHPAKILALGEDGLKQYISTIGLFNAKAKNVIATCAILLEKHGGEVPRDREELEALPGVGRKTANVVLNTAFGEPVMAVDTHLRVANRTGLARKNVREVEG